jgi:hypothetical protein
VSAEAPEKLNGELHAVPVRVRFGPGKDQDMPLSWAEKMLGKLRDSHPSQFGKLLAEVVTER